MILRKWNLGALEFNLVHVGLLKRQYFKATALITLFKLTFS